MPPLPDDAVVVRGGLNLPDNFAQGSGVTVDAGGKVQGVSVNAAPGLSVKELTAPNSSTGYPGIPHNQVGITTVGQVRALIERQAASQEQLRTRIQEQIEACRRQQSSMGEG